MTNQLKIEDNVKFLGYMMSNKLYSVIKLSDVCFADVLLDGFPFKIFEYSIFEKPTIVKKILSVEEIMKDKENACLYKNKSELINSINKLYSSQKYRTKIGKNAKYETLHKHTWNIRIQLFNKLINDIDSKKIVIKSGA